MNAPSRHSALPPTLAPRGLSRVEAAAYIINEAKMFQPRDFPWAEMNGVSGVYFIGYGTRIKIGVSRSIGARLREIAQYIPERLTLFGIIRAAGRTEERELHRRFAQYRLNGEWFDHKGHLAAYVDHIRYGLIER